MPKPCSGAYSRVPVVSLLRSSLKETNWADSGAGVVQRSPSEPLKSTPTRREKRKRTATHTMAGVLLLVVAFKAELMCHAFDTPETDLSST
jgi:hypothetical protein